MSWRHFTVSMNPEFLAKFTLGGNVAIVVLIKWFYEESTLCTSPRLHFKLNAIHGHATWQSLLRLKIEKKPLPNRPIRWRTLYIQLNRFCKHLLFSVLPIKCICPICPPPLTFPTTEQWTNPEENVFCSFWISSGITLSIKVISPICLAILVRNSKSELARLSNWQCKTHCFCRLCNR